LLDTHPGFDYAHLAFRFSPRRLCPTLGLFHVSLDFFSHLGLDVLYKDRFGRRLSNRRLSNGRLSPQPDL
jgi:hypothetical protein